jgi:hypothetical protein
VPLSEDAIEAAGAAERGVACGQGPPARCDAATTMLRRRINIQQRLSPQVLEDVRTFKVLRMWRHYQ